MKLKTEQRVSLPECRFRALNYMTTAAPCTFFKANTIAIMIWPFHQMTSQGAGAAASRVLKNLEKDRLVRWTSNEHDWGWIITAAGRVAVEKATAQKEGSNAR